MKRAKSIQPGSSRRGRVFQHLGPFSDFVEAANRSQQLYPLAKPGPSTRRRLLESLAFAPGPERPLAVRVERRWQRDGIEGEEISWSVGYGPRTRAWVLKPEGERGRLPGLLALHDHGGFKLCGKEKVADGPGKTAGFIRHFRDIAYGGRAFANEMAREGFVVLVHDTFLWGSRRVPYETMPEFDRWLGRIVQPTRNEISYQPRKVATYHWTALFNENTIAKYCTVLGTTFAGVVSFEDRVATTYLAGRPDVLPSRIGCVGLSGGGMRSVLLQGTCARIRGAVVVGAMSTSEGLLDHNIVCHTWMFFPSVWACYGDWADIAAARAPSPLLVQYTRGDPLYTLDGMRAADRRLAAQYRSVGAAGNYRGAFYPGPHKFDRPMQRDACAWLQLSLNS